MDYFKNLCKAGGKAVCIGECTAGNCTFQRFANRSESAGKKAYKAINSRQWDYVVLQENTDWSTARYSSMLKNAAILVKWIKKKSPGVKIIYNATWAYKNGKTIAGHYYSYQNNQNAINKNYKRLQKVLGGNICYSGEAFRKYRSKYSKPSLWLPDNNHPTKAGAYLSACSMYNTIFGSPAGLKYYGSMTETVAKKMQKISAK